MKKEIGMYVHIPFCKKKCSYCDFCSYSGKEDKMQKYFECLNSEIKTRAREAKQEELKVKTIYIGGGTPSYVDSKYIKEIIKTIKENFAVEQNAEMTIEVNPRNNNKTKINGLSKSTNQSS